MLLIVVLGGAVLVLLVFDAGRRAAALAREVERLRRRVDELDRRSRAVDAGVAEVVPAARPAAAPVREIPPAAGPGAAAPAEDLRARPVAAEPAAPPRTEEVRARPAPPSAPGPAEAPPPRVPAAADVPAGAAGGPAARAEAGPPPRDVEQMVGGVWLQNAGAVLLLAGFFFLIVWGYATGRFGGGVLVLAGVLAALGLIWRGARMRRRVRGVGHALIGVGAGVVWLAIYLGHFRLHVLPAPAAFVLIVAASLFTAMLGLRYRAQGVAALGVVGAHLPNLLEALLSLYRFSLPAGALLGYLAALNAAVFALAARAGWSALALASLLLSAATWIGVVPAARWSWPVEIGLAALFAGLGLSPVPRLARAAGRVRPVDLAVIAVAPLALLAASRPMFELANARHVAILLLALATVYTAAAAWVDARRPERDLWRPLSAAAVLFVTAALERLAGPEYTAVAWTAEGAVLVLLGLGPRTAWLRVCGYAVAALGAAGLLGRMLENPNGHPPPLANAEALAPALAIAALLFAARGIARVRESLGPLERVVTGCWYFGAHGLLLVWLARECHHLAWALEGDGGIWRAARDVRGASGEERYRALFAAATGLAWAAQAAWLVRAGLGGRGAPARIAALVVAMAAAAPLLLLLLGDDAWGRDLAPLVHRDGLIALVAIGLAVWSAARLARARGALPRIERRSAELWAAGAALLLLVWIAREADHAARVILGLEGQHAAVRGATGAAAEARLRALAGALTSAGWLVEALAAFVLGWMRRSAFMRWMGLSLIAITVLKFLLLDLASTDPFWRFTTAIGAGAAMLLLSYVYQRAGKARRAPPA